MDDASFNEVVERLKKVNEVVVELDERIRAEAFKLFRGFILPGSSAESDVEGTESQLSMPASTTAESFFTAHAGDKPAENVQAIAAYLYSQHGTVPFGVQELREMADNIGLTVPSRIDMTLGSAKKQGKALFKKSGKGDFQPTVYGEAYFKETYGVSKGKKPKEAAEDTETT